MEFKKLLVVRHIIGNSMSLTHPLGTKTFYKWRYTCFHFTFRCSTKHAYIQFTVSFFFQRICCVRKTFEKLSIPISFVNVWWSLNHPMLKGETERRQQKRNRQIFSPELLCCRGCAFAKQITNNSRKFNEELCFDNCSL